MNLLKHTVESRGAIYANPRLRPFLRHRGQTPRQSQSRRLATAGAEMDLGLSGDSFERTDDSPAAAIQHVRIDHRRLYICVAQKLLDRADVIT